MKAPWFRSQPAAPASAPSSGQGRAPVRRKPRILIAGEFSAGKTQLINGLLGARGDVLPSNVTATALPPVWLVRGEPAILRVGISGRGELLRDLASVDPDKTQYCVLAHPASVLAQMDIIDTPGNSDPNMAAEAWQRMLTYADAVVWCTNATQAWRQSEKAVWQAMPARLRQNATLVVTHADLINGQAMTDRVLQRVQREASAFFDTFIMASLLERNDLDRIGAHLRNLCGSLRLDGAANPLPQEFAAAHPARTPAASAPQTQPRPPAQPAAAAAPRAQAQAARPVAAAPSSPEAAGLVQRIRPAANVLHMIRPRRVAQHETPEPALPVPPMPQSRRQPQLQPQPQPKPQAAAASGRAETAPRGIARTLWDDLSCRIDRNDPVAVLEAVEWLIGRVDAHIGASASIETVPFDGRGRPAPPVGNYE